ncbi:MAG: hypothetical protein JWO12_451, partial [Frankiales bacterium]|nr:hypothetical protein [Frankiales bacterium]
LVQYQVRIRVQLQDGGTEVEHWRLRANV